MSVLSDLKSRDPRRVWSASWDVIYSRDAELLAKLAGCEAEIRDATQGVELGGMLGNAPLAFALRKIAFYAADHPCPCALYLPFNFYDPEREASAGNVVIHEEVRVDGRHTGEYRCACTLCGTRYNVERNEYHYPWWQWSPG